MLKLLINGKILILEFDKNTKLGKLLYIFERFFIDNSRFISPKELESIMNKNNFKGEIIKISFRSVGDFPANELAQSHFSGGGHKNAAGGRSSHSLEETVSRFKELLPSYKIELSETYKQEKDVK